MREREYVRLIPDEEFAPLKALLRRIQTARGWQFSDDAAREQAWARVLATAQSAAGGAWPLNFTPAGVTPAQLQALCDAVEAEFLGGLLAEQVRQAGRPRIRVVLGMDPRDRYSWLSGLHADNTIYVNSERWAEEVSEANPLVFEGAVCRSKLEALAHTLGHELTHAVVLNFFPAMDAASPAYTPDDKHGPVFMWLNRRLFGHVGHASRRLFNI
ncbi:hypothetical protein HYH02_011943 [Chlamydomonas schloesseri]|uniref:Uncharacterized protein n=1 Tax=Chlamydomonas schloesseri TaxID=2026947 RepID=A0A835SYE9_9CHLO|nr:hypothetical protein HYH02_011943 [Chlamydomonas schloesseri]|eukprot:KAG2435443.1 hypothetical protein HYH02_011943 [Chlamydomonas schloesseri]